MKTCVFFFSLFPFPFPFHPYFPICSTRSLHTDELIGVYVCMPVCRDRLANEPLLRKPQKTAALSDYAIGVWGLHTRIQK